MEVMQFHGINGLIVGIDHVKENIEVLIHHAAANQNRFAQYVAAKGEISGLLRQSGSLSDVKGMAEAHKGLDFCRGLVDMAGEYFHQDPMIAYHNLRAVSSSLSGIKCYLLLVRAETV